MKEFPIIRVARAPLPSFESKRSYSSHRCLTIDRTSTSLCLVFGVVLTTPLSTIMVSNLPQYLEVSTKLCSASHCCSISGFASRIHLRLFLCWFMILQSILILGEGPLGRRRRSIHVAR
jgi:hypothetical protein